MDLGELFAVRMSIAEIIVRWCWRVTAASFLRTCGASG